MFRRPRRPLAPLNALPPAMSQALNDVERLAGAGEYLQAASMVSQLAQAANSRGRPRWAANLQTRAAHLYVEARKGDEALDMARQALTTFLRMQMEDRARQFYHNLGRRMQARGMAQAAAAFSQEFGGRFGALALGEGDSQDERESDRGTLKPPSQQAQHGRLPGACPACGAPVRSDRVDWIDEHSAECSYCAAVIPAE